MQRDEIVRYVRAYADSFSPNIKEGVSVERIVRIEKTVTEENVTERKSDARPIFEVETSVGKYTAEQVVIATGGYHQPKIPPMRDRFPSDLLQIHSSEYKNPQSLPDGGVLVVGTGQSGCQIAEDLHLAGKQVHLCVGGAPRSPREYRGKDVVAWLEALGYYDIPIDEHPQKERVRTKTNHYVTGRGGGREIDLRQFAAEGMKLYGRLESVSDFALTLKDDLAQNLDYADSVAERIKRTIDAYIEKNSIDAPVEPTSAPVWEPETAVRSLNLDAENIQTIIWATGYHMDFSWVDVLAFDDSGYPHHQRGVSSLKGLYFVGLPWLYTWGSGRFSGVAQDAVYLADEIAAQVTERSRDSVVATASPA